LVAIKPEVGVSDSCCGQEGWEVRG
jgi:hypothetical protein